LQEQNHKDEEKAQWGLYIRNNEAYQQHDRQKQRIIRQFCHDDE